MMRSASFVLTVLVVVLGVAQVADAFGAGTLPLSSSRKMRALCTRTLRMAEPGTETETETTPEVTSDMRQRGVDARRTSFFSRNLSEEKINQKTYYDIENKGELLVSPDRVDEWGEELTEIGKWQRTNGPIYVQGAGGALFVLGFVNYFALGDASGLSSSMWTLSVLVALLGFALQRKTD